MRVGRRIIDWLKGLHRTEAHRPAVSRAPVTHVVILDGTASSLDAGEESNAGLTYKLLCEAPNRATLSIYYEAGIQWTDWKATHDVATGRGINRQIRRAYGYLASRYRPGDRIILMGYSRGAYAARSLAGVIDSVGLLQARHATARNVRQAYRHYQSAPPDIVMQAFRDAWCHDAAPVEMIGVWDTVKALGLRLPLLWQFTEPQHAFHNHRLSPIVRRGFQALALEETRAVFAPVMWEDDGSDGRIEQVWFRGTHGDVGGQLGGFEAARPLANIPLVWMLEKLEACGVALPEGWQGRYPCDPSAASVGTLRSWGKMFLIRHARKVGRYGSERIHPSAAPTTSAPDLPIATAGQTG